MPLLRYGRALTWWTTYFPSDSWDFKMSTTNKETETNKEGSDAPKQSEENNTALDNIPVKMEVNSTIEIIKGSEETFADDDKTASTTDVTDSNVGKIEEVTDKRKKPNNPTRKRFNWLLEHGYSREEADKLARDAEKVKELRSQMDSKLHTGNPPHEANKNRSGAMKKQWALKNALISKRTNSLSSNEPPNKISKQNMIDNSISMAVAPVDYPQTRLSKEQGEKIKSGILEQVIQSKTSKPRFEQCVFKRGYLLIVCSDHHTREWLQRIIPKLELWTDAPKIKVLSERKLLKFSVFIAVFPDSEQNTENEIFKYVECQNDGIDTSKWAVFSRKVVDKSNVSLKFSVDSASSTQIRQLKFELNYKFGKVAFNLTDAPQTNQSTKQPVQLSKPSLSILPYNMFGTNLNKATNNVASVQKFQHFGGTNTSTNSFGPFGRNSSNNASLPFSLIDSLFGSISINNDRRSTSEPKNQRIGTSFGNTGFNVFDQNIPRRNYRNNNGTEHYRNNNFTFQ